MKRLFLFFYLSVVSIAAFAAEQFVVFTPTDNHFPLISQGVPCPIYVDSSEDKGVMIAVGNLQQDILQVCGTKPVLLTNVSSKHCVIVGTYSTPFVKKLIAANKIDKKELEGKNEKYILQVVTNPCEGVDEAVVIIGSDRRGTIYGIYELSEQMGVSPWYWWADVPIRKQQNVYVKPGQYTDGEPAVTYRGIFLNDEAPCLTGWVKQTYGTNYGDHRFYTQVYELILRLKGNSFGLPCGVGLSMQTTRRIVRLLMKWESSSVHPTTNQWHATIRNGHASAKNMVHGIIQLTKK